MTRWTALLSLVLVGCGASAPCSQPAMAPTPRTSTTTEPPAELDALRATIVALGRALRDGDAAALTALADPELGAWLWTTPGCCAAPTVHHPGESFFADEAHAAEAKRAGEALLATLPGAVVNEHYALPDEDALEAAPPWGTFEVPTADGSAGLDRAALRALHGILDLETRAELAGELLFVTHGFRAEHGYTQARVYLRRVDERFVVLHVLVSTHYDA
ncbi:MAG: hypothetical protein KF901_05800 [Myxococcales bacterium]|nr:hypothetical protein [Myxococcales bacterium]